MLGKTGMKLVLKIDVKTGKLGYLVMSSDTTNNQSQFGQLGGRSEWG